MNPSPDIGAGKAGYAGGAGGIQARRALGRDLARLRHEAGFTQQGLAGRLSGYSRASVADAERGRRHHARDFWSGCDAALKSGGLLAARYDQLVATLAADAAVRAAAEAAEAAGQVAGTTTVTYGNGLHPAGGDSPGRSAPAVTICCPNCGHSLAIMTVIADMPAATGVPYQGRADQELSRPATPYR